MEPKLCCFLLTVVKVTAGHDYSIPLFLELLSLWAEEGKEGPPKPRLLLHLRPGQPQVSCR